MFSHLSKSDRVGRLSDTRGLLCRIMIILSTRSVGRHGRNEKLCCKAATKDFLLKTFETRPSHSERMKVSVVARHGAEVSAKDRR
jgi:hypothetical protein